MAERPLNQARGALEATLERLQRERDQLRVKLHLAEMDAKDEYERLSKRIDELRAQYEPVRDAVGDTADNVFSALGLAADELWHGMSRIGRTIRGGD